MIELDYEEYVKKHCKRLQEIYDIKLSESGSLKVMDAIGEFERLDNTAAFTCLNIATTITLKPKEEERHGVVESYDPKTKTVIVRVF